MANVSKNGYTVIYPPTSAVSIVGADNTTGYVFGKKMIAHHFCKTCGVPTYMVVNPSYGDVLAVNVKVLIGVEWDDMNIKRSEQGTGGYVVA
jgi:hypothetical protein